MIELARLLDRKRDITVVTNDLVIATLLEDHDSVKIVFLGGTVRKRFHCTVFHDLASRRLLFRADRRQGVHGTEQLLPGEGGEHAPHRPRGDQETDDVPSRQRSFSCSTRAMGRNWFAQFATIDEVDTVVTDSISDADRKALEDTGIQVIVPE